MHGHRGCRLGKRSDQLILMCGDTHLLCKLVEMVIQLGFQRLAWRLMELHWDTHGSIRSYARKIGHNLYRNAHFYVKRQCMMIMPSNFGASSHKWIYVYMHTDTQRKRERDSVYDVVFQGSRVPFFPICFRSAFGLRTCLFLVAMAGYSRWR